MQTAVVAWLVVAIHAWGARPEPAAGTPARADLDARYETIAAEIVAVAFDATEPPLYPGPQGRARTALLLASIDAHESRYEERIARGRCNRGECDSGLAVGAYQIHAGPYGIRLVGERAARCTANAPDCITAADLARDDVTQARVALHIIRTIGLGGFCGERLGVEGATSAARRGPADAWMRDNPPPAEAVAEDAVAVE
jgi:hypothetical protein